MTDYSELIKQLREYANEYEHGTPTGDTFDDAAAAIEALQAEVERLEPKRGKWIEENRRPRSSQFVCSECHRTAYDPQPTRDKAWRKRCRYAYCPNCGAKMIDTAERSET